MKEVITVKTKLKTIEASKVSPIKYYGVRDSVGDRGFITRSEYESGDYIVLCVEEVTEGNGYYTDTTESLSELITSLVNLEFKVYEFDTYKELFKWLSE
jgi:hypothetical protein